MCKCSYDIYIYKQVCSVEVEPNGRRAIMKTNKKYRRIAFSMDDGVAWSSVKNNCHHEWIDYVNCTERHIQYMRKDISMCQHSLKLQFNKI